FQRYARLQRPERPVDDHEPLRSDPARVLGSESGDRRLRSGARNRLPVQRPLLHSASLLRRPRRDVRPEDPNRRLRRGDANRHYRRHLGRGMVRRRRRPELGLRARLRGHPPHPRAGDRQDEVARRIRPQTGLLTAGRREGMPRLALGLALSLALAGPSLDALAETAPPVATAQFDYYVMTLSWAPGFCDLGGQDSVYPNDRLAAYEYRKHGTCTGLSAHDYFATVREVKARLNIPPMFKAPAHPLRLAPEEVERAFIEANPNLRADNMAVTCSNGELMDVRFCIAKDLSSYALCRKVARHTCQRGSIVIAPVR